MNEEEHRARIKKDLKAVGVTSYGLLKSEGRHLYQVIHPDEHIGGAAYGQIGHGESAFLVATDKRVIFYDHKPGYSTFDELTYDVVSGVKSSRAAFFSTVVLHTRIADYTVRFVNPKSAHIFTEYIERKRLETDESLPQKPPIVEENSTSTVPDSSNEQGVRFLREHDLGVLSTVDRTGNVHGAIIYYLVDQINNIYILTKSSTGKGRNVFAHSQVALTVHEVGTLQTLQLQGIAEVETDQSIKDWVFSNVVKPRNYRGNEDLPPVTKLHEGSFMVIKITPTLFSYHDYASKE